MSRNRPPPRTWAEHWRERAADLLEEECARAGEQSPEQRATAALAEMLGALLGGEWAAAFARALIEEVRNHD